MMENTKQRVLLLYKSMIPSVRLCGHCQLEALAEQGKIEYRHKKVIQVSRDDLAWAQVVFMCRLDDRYEHWLARTLKKAGKTVVYVMDDDLLNVPADLTSGKYYRQKGVQRSIRGILGMSDAMVSPSPVLLGKYAKDGCKLILLEEPAIDPLTYAPRQADSPIRIGFAGSVDRTGDIEQILRESLLKIHAEYGQRVSFVFFGAVPSFAKDLDAQCIPYCDSYDAYRKTLNELQLDIGLAPMPDTPFHACKHYNKFVEYAAAGIVGIFSNVKPYDRLAQNFGWELLCENSADQWYSAMKQLLDDPQKLDTLKHQVTDMAGSIFSVPYIAESLLRELEALPPKTEKPLRAAALPLMKGYAIATRILSGLKRYGCKAPAIALRRLQGILKR